MRRKTMSGLGLIERYYAQIKAKGEKQKKESEQKAESFSKGMAVVAAKMEAAKIANAGMVAILDQEQAEAELAAAIAEEKAKIGPLGLTWVEWGFVAGGSIISILLFTGGQKRS